MSYGQIGNAVSAFFMLALVFSAIGLLAVVVGGIKLALYVYDHLQWVP